MALPKMPASKYICNFFVVTGAWTILLELAPFVQGN